LIRFDQDNLSQMRANPRHSPQKRPLQKPNLMINLASN
jgi:hypothetical protein